MSPVGIYTIPSTSLSGRQGKADGPSKKLEVDQGPAAYCVASATVLPMHCSCVV